MADAVAEQGFLPALTARLRKFSPGSDIGLALGVVMLLSVLVLPLPTMLLDFGLALSITSGVLVLMVALFLNRPLDFSSFPTLLLLTTLLRLSLNVAITRLILSHGNEGPLAAGHVVAAFGGFLMGGDVVIGLIIFSILLVVNFMVITKGSGRIAEVAARFSLDAMPGKQMAIDADLSSGLIDEKEARRRRRELEEESGFYGAMDGAAKFVRGDAIAALIITVINILGGLTIGLVRHGMSFSDAAATFTTLTAGDGLVTQIPALLVSTAAGIVVTKGGMEGTADVALIRQLGRSPKPLAMAAGAATVLALLPGAARAAVLGAGRAGRRRRLVASQAPARRSGRGHTVGAGRDGGTDQRRAAHRHDPPGTGLWTADAGGRRDAPADRADQRDAPVDRVRDGFRPAAGAHPGQYAVAGRPLLHPHQGDRGGHGRIAPDHAAGDGSERWRRRAVAGEPTREPAFGLPAMWIDPSIKEEALFRGCTVVDPPSVLTTHLTEVVRENMAELLSYAETQKLLDELPREQQKLVADLIPSQITVGGVQRVLQSLLSERVSIRDLATILEGIQEACGGAARAIPAIVAHVRARLARQISDSHIGAGGYHAAGHAVGRMGGGVRGGAERTGRRSPARHGAQPATGIHAAAARGVRDRGERRRVAGAADIGRHPQPRARDRRADPPYDAGARPVGDLSARADPHGGHDMRNCDDFSPSHKALGSAVFAPAPPHLVGGE